MTLRNKRRVSGLVLAASLFITAGCSGSGNVAASTQTSASLSALTSGQSSAVSNDVAPAASTMNNANTAANEDNAVLGGGSGFTTKALSGTSNDQDGDQGDRTRLAMGAININADGSIDIGGLTFFTQIHVNGTVITYDPVARTFKAVTTVTHTRHRRHFTSTDVTTRIYNAAGLSASVSPASITTLAELKALDLPLLEVDQHLTVTDNRGSHDVVRTETFSGTTETIHEDITESRNKNDRDVHIIEDSTLNTATGVETGTATVTVSLNDTVERTLTISFTENHDDGTGTETIVDTTDSLKGVIVLNADGTETGTLTNTTSGQVVGNIDVGIDGSGTVVSAGASLSIDL